jgi:hypothetical protein
LQLSSPTSFGFKRTIKTPYVAKKGKFPDESLKSKQSSHAVQTTFALAIFKAIVYALSAPVFYYSLLLNVCDFNPM